MWREGCGRRVWRSVKGGGRGEERGCMERGGVEEEEGEILGWCVHKSHHRPLLHTHTHTHAHARATHTHAHTHTYTHTDRSTVEFAREVAETKAMDDALDRLDEMFGSSGSHDNFTSPRVGSPPGRDHSTSISGLHLARWTPSAKSDSDLIKTGVIWWPRG